MMCIVCNDRGMKWTISKLPICSAIQAALIEFNEKRFKG
jgi:hypothetical protein